MRIQFSEVVLSRYAGLGWVNIVRDLVLLHKLSATADMHGSNFRDRGKVSGFCRSGDLIFFLKVSPRFVPLVVYLIRFFQLLSRQQAKHFIVVFIVEGGNLFSQLSEARNNNQKQLNRSVGDGTTDTFFI